jgi:hypothetical protein
MHTKCWSEILRERNHLGDISIYWRYNIKKVFGGDSGGMDCVLLAKDMIQR